MDPDLTSVDPDSTERISARSVSDRPVGLRNYAWLELSEDLDSTAHTSAATGARPRLRRLCCCTNPACWAKAPDVSPLSLSSSLFPFRLYYRISSRPRALQRRTLTYPPLARDVAPRHFSSLPEYGNSGGGNLPPSSSTPSSHPTPPARAGITPLSNRAQGLLLGRLQLCMRAGWATRGTGYVAHGIRYRRSWCMGRIPRYGGALHEIWRTPAERTRYSVRAAYGARGIRCGRRDAHTARAGRAHIPGAPHGIRRTPAERTGGGSCRRRHSLLPPPSAVAACTTTCCRHPRLPPPPPASVPPPARAAVARPAACTVPPHCCLLPSVLPTRSTPPCTTILIPPPTGPTAMRTSLAHRQDPSTHLSLMRWHASTSSIPKAMLAPWTTHAHAASIRIAGRKLEMGDEGGGERSAQTSCRSLLGADLDVLISLRMRVSGESE
ncbi:hypothetical protein EVG20_g7112 [Dentipellis fragilis]|uniref:Uncharacterized protein n=1 Tax=Dentipellis fragilis TaxID=205917 RepID=A0A4Y9YK27_9AGAM|nr:hypothetical protein EVG20_g7112 [Dentipellis fragilis]